MDLHAATLHLGRHLVPGVSLSDVSLLEVGAGSGDANDSKWCPMGLAGTLWKQSPSVLRWGQYQRRHVVVSGGQLTWSVPTPSAGASKLNADALRSGPHVGGERRGELDLRSNHCLVQPVPSSETQFTVRPVGDWRTGAFTGSTSSRVFRFDAKDSEHDRDAWIKAIESNIQWAPPQKRATLPTYTAPPLPDDDGALQRQRSLSGPAVLCATPATSSRGAREGPRDKNCPDLDLKLPEKNGHVAEAVQVGKIQHDKDAKLPPRSQQDADSKKITRPPDVETKHHGVMDSPEAPPQDAAIRPSVDRPRSDPLPLRLTSFRHMSRVAAGHMGGVLKELEGGDHGDGNNREEKTVNILKELDPIELAVYARLSANPDDPIHGFVPEFRGEALIELEPEGAGDKPKCKRYLRLSNVLSDFTQPFVMDVKVGVRSFIEKECASQKPREDLYERLLKADPSLLTDEEKRTKSITKFKWMTYRDSQSSSVSLGFRIDGIAGPGNLKLRSDAFHHVQTREQVVEELIGFLPPPRKFRCRIGDCGDSPEIQAALADTKDEVVVKSRLAKTIVEELHKVRDACERSDFFATHEFIGSSLLIVTDIAPVKAKVYLIDFAKVELMEQGMRLSHRKAWELGNHEDGFLMGVDECITCWTEVSLQLEREVESLEESDNVYTRDSTASLLSLSEAGD